MSTNRIVALASSVLLLAIALIPALTNMDWTSTAGIAAGLVAVAGIVLKWLDGWQKHEQLAAYHGADAAYAAGHAAGAMTSKTEATEYDGHA